MPNTITLITGPNGVGKSALLYQIYRNLGKDLATYLPGHRQIHFNNNPETGGQDSISLATMMYQNPKHFSRYKGNWAEDHFKSIIRALCNKENAYNRDFRAQIATSKKGGEDAKEKVSPVDQLNLIFSRSGLPIEFTFSDYGFSAKRGGTLYSIEALSDGERAALYLAASILSQPPGRVLLIDEPERHLHPSITGILVETALRTRSDIALVLCSHDITLIERLEVKTTIYVRDSVVRQLEPETRVFDTVVILDGEIPDELRVDVLGSRSKILYVEGSETSRDAALYGAVFPGWKVLSKGGSEAVIEATRGLTSSSRLHWVKAAGLVDGDGRAPAEVEKLSASGVFVLRCPAVENLFFIEEAQRCYVDVALQMRGGASWEDRQQRLAEAVKTSARTDRDLVVARKTLWLIQREVSQQPLSVRDIQNDTTEDIAVSVKSIRDKVRQEVDQLVEEGDYREILLCLPIKGTNIPAAAAHALGAYSFKEYCDVIQYQIDIESRSGRSAVAALVKKLPVLDGS